MKKYISLFIISIICVGFAGCEYDNFDEPTSILTGKIEYNGKPVGVRTNGPQIELWQDGYELKKNIPVYIAHDGTYSVSLFNGQYKMVRKAGAPWEPQLSDTIVIDVKGRTEYNVPVTPYFVIENESFQKSGNTLTAKFVINKNVSSADLAEVKLYVGQAILTDQNKKEHEKSLDVSTVIIGQEATISTTLPDNLANMDYIFVRVGVRANVTSEFYYTQVQKVNK
jgi:hypothetical protein